MTVLRFLDYYVCIGLNHLVWEAQAHKHIMGHWPGRWIPRFCQGPQETCTAIVAFCVSDETPDQMTDRLITLLGGGVRTVRWFLAGPVIDGPGEFIPPPWPVVEYGRCHSS